MSDDIDLGGKFLDEHVFACPFCSRRNVAYLCVGEYHFVRCTGCAQTSMHRALPPVSLYRLGGNDYRFDAGDDTPLDDRFFHPVPTSFVVTDDRVPQSLRELMTEAEGCLKGGFLTGASACARKVVVALCALHDAPGATFAERLTALRRRQPSAGAPYVEALLSTEASTRETVREETYDAWDAAEVRVILSMLSELIFELYVVPAMREAKRRTRAEATRPAPAHTGPRA